jgi:hypothetical protein
LSDAQELRPLALSALAQLPHPRGLALAESLAQNQSLRPHAEQVIAQIRSALAGKAAVASSSHNNEIASLAIDSDPATRWKSGSMQMPGIWYMIDLKAELSLRGVDLLLTDARPNDYPRGLEVYVSNSMEHFGKPVAVVQGQSPVTPITFDQPVHGRFIRLVCTQVDRAHWSIYDIKLHTSAPAASSAK